MIRMTLRPRRGLELRRAAGLCSASYGCRCKPVARTLKDLFLTFQVNKA